MQQKMEYSDRYTYIYRMVIAVCWIILFQFLLITTYITIMNTNVWDLSGLTSLPFHCLSLKSLYFIPLVVVIILLGFVWWTDYNKPPNSQFINRRFLLLINLFSYDNLVTLLAYLCLGIAIPSIYASLSNGSISSISVKCNIEGSYSERQLCLNERKFFLILGGIWIALYTFFKEYTFSTKILIFPPIQQPKFRRFKATLTPCLKKCMINAIFPSLLFCICYYFKGNLPRLYLSLLFRLEMSGHLLDSLYELLDKEVIFYLWLFSTIYLLTLDVMTNLFNIHLTERAYFPVGTLNHALKSLGDSKNNFNLEDAILAEDFPVIQHLGFLDLALLSQMDCKRRQELFMLSQPGGHPHNWRSIVNACFKVIDKFTVELNKCIEDTQPKQVNKPENTAKNVVFTPTHSHHHSYMINHSIGSNATIVNESAIMVLQKSCENFFNVYLLWIRGKFDAFCKKSLIAYLFGEMDEPKIKHLLLQSQRVTWAVESLSYLVCHSIKEDNFGVAQEDLQKVVTMLLNLKNGIDKLNKQCIFITKSNKLDLVDIQMKNALKFTLKQSIYRIAITFKNFICDINLKPFELVAQMRSFVDMKEV